MIRPTVIFMVAFGFLLVGCEDEEASAPVERIRAVKTYVVSEPAGSDTRRYSGTLVASDTSALSFPVTGTVKSVDAEQGERVSVGQVLATLDLTPFQLDRDAALAELRSAEAELSEKQADLNRQRTLFQKGWVAKAALDQAVSAAEGA